MKKIIVIGCPGSGKSTFSKALHTITGIPLFHLDNLYWNPNKTTVEQSLFMDRLSAILQQDEWIVDGNYASTMEWRMEACDTVMFLDYSTDVCLEGVRQRRGIPRSDIPWVEIEDDAEFMTFIRDYHTQNRPAVMDLLKRYAHKEIHVFSDRDHAKAFLTQLLP